jgi:hypothetical protein
MLQPLYTHKKPINCYIGDRVDSTTYLSVVEHTNVPFLAHIKPWPHSYNQSVYLQFIIYHKTWTLTKRDRKQLNVFERKVYKRILGPVYDSEKENWRILTNKEIYASVKKPTIIETVRLNRLRWFGHV